VVFTIGGDPVRFGLVSSLNRPGGHVTGILFNKNVLSAKRVELLREIAANVSCVALLMNPPSDGGRHHWDSEARDKERSKGWLDGRPRKPRRSAPARIEGQPRGPRQEMRGERLFFDIASSFFALFLSTAVLPHIPNKRSAALVTRTIWGAAVS
jgi:hypothetical protein